MGADLFSEGLIRSYVDDRRFVERPWLADLVEEKLADRGCRFLLFTGEPGSGKTALMAWLARRQSAWPRYFIRRDSQVPLNSGDARSLLFAIGHQLAALRPSLFYPDKLEVIVRQRVAEVAAGGRAVAARVEDLAVSPFYETAVRVEQEAGFVAGTLAGIEVGRLVAEERFLELTNLQYLALLDPAELLLNEAPAAQLVIVVDALDELRYQTARESALDWLAACPELPGNVRFLLSSRPDERLLDRFRRSQRQWLREAVIDSNHDEVEADLRRYGKSFAAGANVAEALHEEGIGQKHFVAAAASHADGNFQYLAALFRGVERALERLTDTEDAQGSGWGEELRRLLRLEEVPAGLGELYAFFLSLVRDASAGERVEVRGAAFGEVERMSAWEGLYQPVLGVLAVASEPLTLEQLARFVGFEGEERWPRSALARLGQFLDDQDGHYRLYHASLPEYLTAAETRASHPDDYLDSGEWHRKVAAYGIGLCGKDWAACGDAYVLAHTPAHLVAAIRTTERSRREELVNSLAALLSDIGFLEKKVRTLGVEAVLRDLSESRTVLPDQGVVRDAARAIHQEAHHLRRWRPQREPAVFAQQIYNRAVTLEMPELTQLAAARLNAIALPALRLRWRSKQGSSALLATLSLSGTLGGSVALTSEGRIVSSAGRSLKVWDIDTGAELAVLTGHEQRINAVAAVSDCRAISASADGTLRVWDLRSGTELAVLAGHQKAVNDVAIAHDARAVSASDDRTLRVWDIETGNQLAVLSGHTDVVKVVATTADGRALSTSGDWTKDWTIRVWDIETARQLAVLSGHTGSLRAIAGTPDGRIVSSANDGTLRVWDVETQEVTAVLKGHTSWVPAFALTSDGRAVSASSDKTLRVWELQTGKTLAVMTGHEGFVHAVALTGDGRAISGSSDRTLRVWDIETGNELAVFAGHENAVEAVAVTGDGRAVSGSADGTVRVWDLRTASSRAAGHGERVTAIAFTGDGRVVSGAADWTLRVWECETGRQLAPLDLVWGKPLNLAAAERWAIILRAPVEDDGDRGGLSVWDFESDEPTDFESPGNVINDIAVAADGRVVGALADGTLRIWEVEPPREVAVLTGHDGAVVAVTLANDGRAVSASEDRSLRVWDLKTARELAVLSGHEGAVRAVAVTGAGRVVSGSDDGTLRIWNINTGVQLATLARDVGTTTALSCARDNRVVSLSDSGTLQSWDINEVIGLAVLGEDDIQTVAGERDVAVSTGWISNVALTELGYVISTHLDRRLRVWDIETGAVIATVYADAPIVATAACGADVTVGDVLGGVASFELVEPSRRLRRVAD